MHCVLVSKDPVLASTIIGSTAPDTIIACCRVDRESGAYVHREHIYVVSMIMWSTHTYAISTLFTLRSVT